MHKLSLNNHKGCGLAVKTPPHHSRGHSEAQREAHSVDVGSEIPRRGGREQ